MVLQVVLQTCLCHRKFVVKCGDWQSKYYCYYQI